MSKPDFTLRIDTLPTDSALAPCPFCGLVGEVAVKQMKVPVTQRCYRVACDNNKCILLGPLRANREEAINAWNGRAA